MRRSLTTICCSAVALILAFRAAPTTQSPAAHRVELPLFPVRTAWTLTLGNRLTGAPGFGGRFGFFPVESQLDAYDLVDGSRTWRAEITSPMAPVAGGGHVFLVEPATAIAALHESSGVSAWRIPFADPLGSPLVWDNGWLIATTSAGIVHAMRASDGTLIWKKELGAAPSAAPALAADRVYVAAADRRLVALDVTSGEQVWEQKLDGVPGEIAADEERIYFGAGDRFYCLLASSGRVDWAWRAGADVVGRPLLEGDRVYFVALDNALRALDSGSGNQRWRRTLPLRPASGPVRAADALVVRGLGALMRAYSARTGEALGDLPASGDLVAAPHALVHAGIPMVVAVTRQLDTGAVVRAVARSVEPPISPLTPLPGLVPPPAK